MRRSIFLYSFISCVSLTLALSGCISVGTSPSPRFYMLHCVDKSKISQAFDTPVGTSIGLGPVNIPVYLDKPKIATEDSNNMLKFAEFDRWGEPLETALARVINENLTVMMPQATIEVFPWNLFVSVRYQVIVDVIQMKANLDKDLFLLVKWSIIDLKNKNVAFTKRSEFSQPIAPHNYTGLAEAVSNAAILLSSQIAQGVSDVVGQQGKKIQE